jgi:ferrous iron transport protein B
LTIALAGNPNAGKSTLFNALTGLRQHVGNWPGKTVERRAGIMRVAGREITLIDLPGAYSLSAHSPEELVARDCLTQTPPNAIINVIDATNLERNLYLTVQLLEMGTPVVIALNMADALRSQKATIDVARLSARLANTPVVLISAARNEGLDELVAVALRTAHTPQPSAPQGAPFAIAQAVSA